MHFHANDPMTVYPDGTGRFPILRSGDSALPAVLCGAPKPRALICGVARECRGLDLFIKSGGPVDCDSSNATGDNEARDHEAGRSFQRVIHTFLICGFSPSQVLLSKYVSGGWELETSAEAWEPVSFEVGLRYK
jgi:hypothetical protein